MRPQREAPTLVNHNNAREVDRIASLFRMPESSLGGADWWIAKMELDSGAAPWVRVGTPVSVGYAPLHRGSSFTAHEIIFDALVLEVSFLSVGDELLPPAELLQDRYRGVGRNAPPPELGPPSTGLAGSPRPAGARYFNWLRAR